MSTGDAGNPIAEKRRQRKLENQRLEAAARQRQEELRVQREQELKRQEDERLAAEQRRLDEAERIARQREAELERIAGIERDERNRVLAIERQLKLIGAFCTREMALTTPGRPQCCAVVSPRSLEKPIAGIEDAFVFVGDASCHVSVIRLHSERCLYRIFIAYEAASISGTDATVRITSLSTTRSGHLLVCNQELGVLGFYDLNQLMTLYHTASLSAPSNSVPVIKATAALVATYVFPRGPQAPPSRIDSICVDDTANEVFVSDRLRHCVLALAINPSAVQRDTYVSSSSSYAKHRPLISSSRAFGSKGHDRGQLHSPAGLDVSHYHVVVCDRGNHRLAAFTKRGAFVCHFGSKGTELGQFLDPRDVKLVNVRKQALSRGLSTDANGISNEQFEIVVADTGNFRVQILNESGEFVRVLSLLSSSDQIRFHQAFLAAQYSQLLQLYAGINRTLPPLDGADLRGLFRLTERLHPSCSTYQKITECAHAIREDTARFHHPRSIASLSNEREVVVLDRQNCKLYTYNMDGSMSMWTDLPVASPDVSCDDPPRGLSNVHTSLVIEDHVYMSDPLSHRVAVLQFPSLTFQRYIGATTYGDQALCSEGFIPGELRFPTYLASFYDHDDLAQLRLLVSDSGNHCVSIFDALTGAFCDRIGRGFGHLDGFFDSPQGLAVYENQWLFVCDQRNHRVQVFDLVAKSFTRLVGHEQGTEPGRFSFPLSIAVCGALHRVEKCHFGSYRDAKYCVGDAGNHRLQVLSILDDCVLYVVDARYTPFENPILPTAIVFHEKCSYFLVADSNNRSVAVFRHDGTFVASFGSNLEPENCFQRPTGLQLVVMSGGGDRVVVSDATRMALCSFDLRPLRSEVPSR